MKSTIQTFIENQPEQSQATIKELLARAHKDKAAGAGLQNLTKKFLLPAIAKSHPKSEYYQDILEAGFILRSANPIDWALVFDQLKLDGWLQVRPNRGFDVLGILMDMLGVQEFLLSYFIGLKVPKNMTKKQEEDLMKCLYLAAATHSIIQRKLSYENPN